MKQNKLTLGSLFSGSGGFELAGLMSGITPVWASEIEPFPIRVTTKRLPFVKHLGDVTKIHGAEIEPVDIINGANKPLGLIHQAKVAERKKAVLDFDTVFDLYYDLPHQYRKNATFLCSEHAYRELRKIKTAMGQNMWVDEDTLFGRPVCTTKYLDDAVPGGMPILFGDFSYFWIGERAKIVLRRFNELYASKGQIGFQMHERVDAKLIRPEAMCCLKIKEESA